MVNKAFRERGEGTYRLISLLRTSTYFFTSATSTGSLALKIENADGGAPSST